MILYIAEKPSLGRAIADALPKPLKKEEGCIRAANGDVVSWCFGHLLELAEPEHYGAELKKWRMADLPIVPDSWQMKPKSKTRKQLGLLRRLTKEATQIVHAGDPDREGQLLVDEVIDYLKVTQKKKQQMQRCLINDLSPAAVKKALQRLRSNREFIPLATSALARSRADWLYGINLTRAYTLQGQQAGYRGVLSVGRVQTPVLGLVVRRDLEISQFVSRPFYEVVAQLRTHNGEQFSARWQPSEACKPWQDEEGRVLSEKLAMQVVNKISGQQGKVLKVEEKEKQQPPPLPYTLAQLQIDANKRFGLSAQQVLDSCQQLYEKYQLITYPRSDCAYLPEEMHAESAAVSSVVFNNQSVLERYAEVLDFKRCTKCWNNKRVEAHHAIIPTAVKRDLTKLKGSEQQIYELVARRYLMQFALPHRYLQTRIELEIAGGRFVANARRVLENGWKALQGSNKETQESSLPALQTGDELLCESASCEEKKTQPPKHFTDATLLAAMTGIARYVEDPEVRKVLRETDGLGTEATRAGILELLIKRGFLQRKAKQLLSTDAGQALIRCLPEQASKPDMTAQWEFSLGAISEKELSYQAFMQPLQETLQKMIEQAGGVDSSAFQGLEAPARRKRSAKRRTSSAVGKAKAKGKRTKGKSYARSA